MPDFQPKDPGYAGKVARSFGKQAALRSLGGTLGEVSPGRVEVLIPFSDAFTQQHGFLHGGVTACGLDTACGFAAYSLMPPEAEVLTVEFKGNLLAPARGMRFRFVGEVVKPGRTLTFCEGRAFADDGVGAETLYATMSATMMAVVGRSDVKA